MKAERPNILLIVADDLGVDTFHVDDRTDAVTVQLLGTGSYPLPNISRLVRDGIHFTRAWAQPVCAPTRATLFTGLHPWRNSIGYPADKDGASPTLPTELPSDNVTSLETLGDAVKRAGYQCGIFGKWDLGNENSTSFPTARGWHRHEGILVGGLRFNDTDPPNKAEYEKIIQRDVRYVSWNKVIGDASTTPPVRTGITPEERTYKYATTDEIYSARDWIKQINGQPWWVTLSLIAPHDPFHVPPAGTYTIQFNDPANPSIQECFVAMMESMDYYLGEFFNDTSPEIQNQLKETVIIFVGDNGSQDELDEVNNDDKGSVYIGGVHVPMIIADGGNVFGDAPCYLDADRMSNEKHAMVHIVDIFQTIIDIAGGTASTGYTTDSISMLPYLKNTTADSRFTNWQARAYNFGQFFVPSDSDVPRIQNIYNNLGEQATITDGTYKLNYQQGQYEFSELTFNSATDITDENVTNNFQHPKAIELWQQLTTPGGLNYAEVDDKGTRFPPLPGMTTVNLYRYVRFVALSEMNNNPWTTVADFALLDANGNLMDRSAWTVTADSQELEGENGAFTNAIDGNANTFWHTQWYRQSPPHPHQLYIDLRTAQEIGGFKYLPRQNSQNGHIKDYQLFASQDNINWVLLASGTFENTAFVRTVTFSSSATSNGSRATLPAPMLDQSTFITHLSGDNYQSGDVWEDSSGSNNHAAKADGFTMPALHQVAGYHGKNFQVMRFDGWSGVILPNLNLHPPFTIMLIDRYYGSHKGGTLQSRDANWLLGKWGGQNGCFMESWLHNIAYYAVDNVFDINTATMDQNYYANWYLNGQLNGYRQGAPAPGRLGLCRGGIYGNAFTDADIAVILIWSRVLSDQERQQVEQWLANKYGVSL